MSLSIKTQVVGDGPRLSQSDALDLNAIAHQEARLQTASLTQLVLEHDALGRWLALPYAEAWPKQHAEKLARVTLIWQTIKRRFPEYAAKYGKEQR